MALFGKKKPDIGADGGNGKEAAQFDPQPEKARKWFDHGRAAADSSNFDYALTSYAAGLRLDPETMSAHEAMYAAAVRYSQNGGKPASSKELKGLDGPHPVNKFVAAEFAWMKDLSSAPAALRFLDAAIKAETWAGEVARWHATRILNVLRKQKKKSKSSFIQAKDLFAALGAWDEALAAADEALRMDPTDAELDAEIKDLSAQRAMDQGRYAEAVTQEGGFLQVVKDLERQRELSDAESISGSESVEQRNLARAKRDYDESPGAPDNINKYAQLLKATGTPANQEEAFRVAMKGFEETGQYRFRAFAGDIRIEQAQQNLSSLREAGVDNGRIVAARGALLELQHEEFTERVARYPTDRILKRTLGEIEFERGDYDAAMQCFQEAKDEPRVRVRAGYMLGRCFAAEGWHGEAIEEYKEALERVEPGDKDTELAIRYDLMVSLMEQARAERSLDLARESLGICSTIARKDIKYRDIRECRRQIDQLIRELTGGAPAE